MKQEDKLAGFKKDFEEDSKSAGDGEDEESESEESSEDEEERLAARKAKKLLPKRVKPGKETETDTVESNKKMGVNMDYVKVKAKKHFKNQQSKQRSKRNRNKDKGVMKAKEDIKEAFQEDF